MLISSTMPTPLGPMTAGVRVGASASLCVLAFGTCIGEATRRDLAAQFRDQWSDGTCALLDEVERQLDEYFRRARTAFDLPMSTPGTPFQRRVWAALEEIPYGSTITYTTLAQRVGRPKAQRAVGGANGRNRIAIVVPCHRVVAATGLGGYAGGLDRKQQLLMHESSPGMGGNLFAQRELSTLP